MAEEVKEKKVSDGKFSVGDNNHSVTVIGGEVSGMGTQDDFGLYKPIKPSSETFTTLSENQGVLDTISQNKFGRDGEVTETVLQDAEQLEQNYEKNLASYNNKVAIAEEQAAFYGQDQFSGAQYAGLADVTTLRYPYDMDVEQDHLKITQYEYKRLQSFKEGMNVFENNVQGSRPNYKKDSMKGKPFGPYKGGVILPMPKVSDSNGAEWGKSDLNVFGLTAVSGAASFVNAFDPRQTANSDKFGMKGLFSNLFGDENKELSDAENAEAYRNNLNKEFGMGDRVRNTGFAGMGIAAQEIGKLAGLDITADEFLARSTGTILNPNAELLFQGPVLRDFGFKFLMVARSEEEAKTIREIIRFFKIGSAPNFLGGPSLLGTPNVFQLEYKAGENKLDTVNKFNAMALRTITVDYAPDGFWSAYQDSHPVAVVMSLQFSELKPIYRTDHEATNVGSVGY